MDTPHGHHHPYPPRRPGKLWLILAAIGLLVAGLFIGSRFGAARMMAWEGGMRGPANFQQQGQQQGHQGFWQQQQAPQQQGPQGFRQQGPRGHFGGERGERGGRGGFGGILGAIDGILKIVVLGASLYLLFLVWRDRQRGNGGNGSNGGTAEAPQQSARPGPEEPPYTGMTTTL